MNYLGGPAYAPKKSANGKFLEEQVAVETSLDLDMASAACPSCKIIELQVRWKDAELGTDAADARCGEPLRRAVVETAHKLGAKSVSISYGYPVDTFSDKGATGEEDEHHRPGRSRRPPATTATRARLAVAAGPHHRDLGGRHVTARSRTGARLHRIGLERRGIELHPGPRPGQRPAVVSEPSTAAVSGPRRDISADADPNTGVAIYDSYAPSSGQPARLQRRRRDQRRVAVHRRPLRTRAPQQRRRQRTEHDLRRTGVGVQRRHQRHERRPRLRAETVGIGDAGLRRRRPAGTARPGSARRTAPPAWWPPRPADADRCSTRTTRTTRGRTVLERSGPGAFRYRRTRWPHPPVRRPCCGCRSGATTSARSCRGTGAAARRAGPARGLRPRRRARQRAGDAARGSPRGRPPRVLRARRVADVRHRADLDRRRQLPEPERHGGRGRAGRDRRALHARQRLPGHRRQPPLRRPRQAGAVAGVHHQGPDRAGRQRLAGRERGRDQRGDHRAAQRDRRELGGDRGHPAVLDRRRRAGQGAARGRVRVDGA